MIGCRYASKKICQEIGELCVETLKLKMPAKDASICLHRFPAGEKKKKWIEAMGLPESSVKQYSRIYSRHFRNGTQQMDLTRI